MQGFVQWSQWCGGGTRLVGVLCAGILAAGLGHAEMRTARQVAESVGLSDAEVRDALAGEVVTYDVEPSSARELTVGFALILPGKTPAELVEMLRARPIDDFDPNVRAWAFVGEGSPLADFAKLSLGDDADWAAAFKEADDSVNLSAEEAAAFRKLASEDVAAVEAELRRMLRARLLAYRERGLAGIAPYARDDGDVRSAADELRSASRAMKLLEREAPTVFELLQEIPMGKPDGIVESFRWSQMTAHGEPTIALTHGFAVPDGEIRIAVQRQFYVSTGYNSEQAVGVFLPVQGGTALFYTNRTSTDQVTGFGGGAKRSIGSSLLSAQLEDLSKRVRQEATGGG